MTEKAWIADCRVSVRTGRKQTFCGVTTVRFAIGNAAAATHYSVDLIADGFAILAKAKPKTVEDDMQD